MACSRDYSSAATFLDTRSQMNLTPFCPKRARIIGHRDVKSLLIYYETDADDLADRL